MSPDTIAAIATPPGVGGVGVIRVSGPAAAEVLRSVVPDFPEKAPSHRLFLRRLVSPVDGARLDSALVVLMRGPKSYTGEDVAELQCHGGAVNLRRILDAVCSAGARPALPGEFTRRAFLNQRLDLVQAEAIADLVQAKSDAACRLAQRHLEGRLSREIGRLSERLARALTRVEAAIDFSLEEHVYQLDSQALIGELQAAIGEVDGLLQSYDRGRRLREGIRCVIAGPPNAGKSTLLNRLLQEERAIVSPTPGTTRDYLDAELVLDGQLFSLIDTAGLRDAEEGVEAEGVRRTRQLLETADLALYVVDSTRPWPDAESTRLHELDLAAVLIWNKVDKPTAAPPPATPPGWIGPVPTQLTSVDSLPPVVDALRRAADRLGVRLTSESATLSRARHRDALERGLSHLRLAQTACRDRLDHELVALDLRLAMDAVGEVVGRVTPDDILGRIFADFCVGK